MTPRSRIAHRRKKKKTPLTRHQERILHADPLGLRVSKHTLSEAQLTHVQVHYDPFIRYAKSLQRTRFKEDARKDLKIMGERTVSFKRQRYLEGLLVLFGLGGIPIFWCVCEYTEKLDDETGEGFHDNPITETLKIIMSIDTIITLLLLLSVYSMRIRRQKLLGYCANSHYIWNTSSELKYFLAEAFFLSLHVPPGFDFTIEGRGGFVCHVNVLSSVVLVRLYLVMRILRWTSSFFNPEVEFIALIRGVDVASFRFTMKVLLKRRPTLTLSVLFSCMLGGAVMAVIAFERAMDHSNTADPQPFIPDTYADASFMSLLSAASVGYGVYYPSTMLGEAVCTLIAIIGGLLVLTLFKTQVINFMQTSEKEEVVSNIVTHRFLNEDIRRLGATFIQDWFRLHLIRKIPGVDGRLVLAKENKVAQSARELRSVTRGKTYTSVGQYAASQTAHKEKRLFLSHAASLRISLDGCGVEGLAESKGVGSWQLAATSTASTIRSKCLDKRKSNALAKDCGKFQGSETDVRCEPIADTFREILASQDRVAQMAAEAAALFAS